MILRFFFSLRSAMLRFKLFSICYMHVKTNVYSCTRCPIISSLSLSCTIPKRMTQSEPWTTRQHAANMFSFYQSIYSDRRLRVAGFRSKTDRRCENLIRNILKMREKRCTHRNDNGLISTATQRVKWAGHFFRIHLATNLNLELDHSPEHKTYSC